MTFSKSSFRTWTVTHTLNWRIEIELTGEMLERYDEFVLMCEKQGKTANTRIQELMLGDLLLYNRTINGGL